MELWTEMPRLFPLMRGGGVFLILVGLSLFVGAIGGKRWLIPALITGAALGVVAMAVGGITKWIFAGIDSPSFWQWAILGVAFLAEGFLVSQVVDRISDHSSRGFWMWMLFVVGVHFLILTFSHGPICGLLAVACMVNAYVGLKATTIPYLMFWGLDGLFKIAAGVAMVLVSFS
jgi:hypothetical protein